VALLFEQLAALRVVFRTAAFGVSLACLALVPGVARRPHPSRGLILAAIGIVGLGLLHPSTNTPLAGIAAIALYLAIVAPLFWVPRLAVTPAGLGRVILLIWGFHALSAGVGVLQATFPGRFQPAVSSIVEESGEVAEGMKITLADGTKVWRPMGLTDMPGGAAVSGLYATMFGMGYVAVSRRGWVQGLGAAGMALGLFCIYLAQVRSALVVTGITAAVLLALLVWIGRVGAAVRLGVVLAVVAGGSFAWAYAVGGETVTRRLQTLIEDRPTNVYYANRGLFLEQTVTELVPEYPLGAGLGRWGMIRLYFGDETNLTAPPIWVEIQWTAWVVDGGVPLAVAYAAALVVAVGAAVRRAGRTRDPWLAGWAALIAAYGVAVIGLTFSYAPFIGQPGMEFWFLNAALVAATPRPRPQP
jgi:hypothetical protein